MDVVIVYDRGVARVLEQFLYSDNPDAAFAKRLERERAYRTNEQVEVVLLNASALDDLKVSHARYFDPSAISAENLKAFSSDIVRRIAS